MIKSENSEKRFNSPSQCTEQEHFNAGYRDGLVRAYEIVIDAAKYKTLSASKLAEDVLEKLQKLITKEIRSAGE